MNIAVKILLRTLGLSLVLAFTHLALISFTPLSLEREFLFKSHIFLTVLTLFTLLFLVYVWKILYDKVGFAFLAMILLKMAASVAFLMPLIKDAESAVTVPVLHFFAVYFLYLIYDVLQVIRLLKNQPK